MLAKWWKKVLLAVCIIACIFNIMSKLVNRHSLKENLESANDGVTVFSFFQKKEVEVTEKEEVIDNVMSGNYTEQVPEEEQVNVENTDVINTEENVNVENAEQNVPATETNTTENSTENPTENTKQTDNKTYQYKDFLTNLFNF